MDWGRYNQQPFWIWTQTKIFQIVRQTQALQDTKKCRDMNGIWTRELWCFLNEGVSGSNWDFRKCEEGLGLDSLWYIVSKPACYWEKLWDTINLLSLSNPKLIIRKPRILMKQGDLIFNLVPSGFATMLAPKSALGWRKAKIRVTTNHAQFGS